MRGASLVLIFILAASPALVAATADAQPATGTTGHAEGPLHGEVSGAEPDAPTRATAHRHARLRKSTSTVASAKTRTSSKPAIPDATSTKSAATRSVRAPGGMRPGDSDAEAGAMRGVSDGAAMKARGASSDQAPGGPHG